VRFAIASEPHSLDPILSQTIPENDIDRLFADPLVACDARGNPIPALAERVPTTANGGISADGLTIVYHLRRDVRWHDGVPFTSADVAFSVKAVLDPRNPVVSRHGFDDIRAVETPDPYTVRFRLKRRFAPFVATIFAESDSPYYLVPKHVLEREPSLVHAAFNTAPVGTGPFRVVAWKRGDAIELAANPAYFGGKPRVERLVIRFVPDENTALAQIRSGEINGILNLGATSAAQLRGDPAFTLVAQPYNGYYGLMFNTRHVALGVRRAIAAAIDAERFRTVVSRGFYGPGIADLPPFLWAADRALAPLPHDPAAARALFAAAGISRAHPLMLDLAIISGYRTHQSWSLLLQSELAPYGVDVRIKPYLGAIFAAPAMEGGILARGRYDAAIYGWDSGMDPDDSSQFLCDQRPPAGYDDSFYCDPEMDAAQHRALENYDQATRKRAYADVERLLLRDVPIAFVAAPASITALRGVDGFSPSSVTDTANAERWSTR
jgi:peptide/nickel transport system substrate-binding protein